VRKNVIAVLGRNPIWWCWPSTMEGTGLKYEVTHDPGRWTELNPRNNDIEDLEDGACYNEP
jgi:palmitoyltransferase ZDHHC6